jgi:hypothetical protein
MPDVVIPVHPSGSGSWLHRQQEVAPGEFAPEVYTVTAVTAAVAQQKFFIVGSGALVLTAAGNCRATVANPADSGVNVNATGEASLRMVAFAANAREEIDLPPLVLTPGVTLGVNIPISATSSRTLMTVYWWEEAV